MKLHPVGLFLAVTALALSGCGLFSADPEPDGRERQALVELARSGRAEIGRGMLQSGMEKLRTVLRQDRNSMDALNGLALAHAMRGEMEIARIFFDRASEIDPIASFQITDLEALADYNATPLVQAPRYRLVGLGLYGWRLRNVVEDPAFVPEAGRASKPAEVAGGVGAPQEGSSPADGRDDESVAAFRRDRTPPRDERYVDIRNARNVAVGR
ncbi:MAG: hypothetical protein R3C97_07250 [Geminicoccaceae bacterium]